MFSYYKKFVLGGILLVLSLWLVACSLTGDNSAQGNTGSDSTNNQGSPSATVAAIIPRQVAPKAGQNALGKGPQIMTGQTPVPGGKVGSQEIVLKDRTLTINSIGKQKSANANAVLVNLGLTVQNTSSKTIMNQSTFFLLMGAEGDIFNYQSNSSDNFYGAVAAHTANSGTITFQLPASATTTSLSLMYRPEIAAETAIILLKIQ